MLAAAQNGVPHIPTIITIIAVIFLLVFLFVGTTALVFILARAKGTAGIINEYEEGIVKRLGKYSDKVIRFKKNRRFPLSWTGGIFFRFPIGTEVIRVNMKLRSLDVPAQQTFIGRIDVSFDMAAAWYVIDSRLLVSQYEIFEEIVSDYIVAELLAEVSRSSLDDFISRSTSYIEGIQSRINAKLAQYGAGVHEVFFQKIDISPMLANAMAGHAIAGYNSERDQRRLQQFMENELPRYVAMVESTGLRGPEAHQRALSLALLALSSFNDGRVVMPAPMFGDPTAPGTDEATMPTGELPPVPL